MSDVRNRNGSNEKRHTQFKKIMKIIIDDKIPFLKGVLEPYASTVYKNGAAISSADVKEADALIIRTRTRCDAALLGGSRIRFIASATIGHDHIDGNYCETSGISWKNAPGCNAGSVVQYVAAALSVWSNRTGETLQGKIIGIVGVGNTGSGVERLCGLLGMKVLRNDPPRERREGSAAFVDLRTVLHEADILSFHVPLNCNGKDKTLHLIDGDVLSRMGGCSLLINTSRGEVIHNGALKKALQAGGIKDAVLDVWEQEPAIDRTLIPLLLLATPHIAGYSADGKANGTAMAVQAVAGYFGFSDLQSWVPESIPAPEQAECAPYNGDADGETLLKRAILHSYPIEQDDARLRASPQEFEQLRGNYPLRREFPAYTVHLNQSDRNLAKQLEKIGFRVSFEIKST